MIYRVISAVLGGWLAVSPLIWQSTPTRGFMDLVLGTLLLTTGICGVFFRSLRFFDGAVGFCLVASFFLVDSMHLWQGLMDAGLGILFIVFASLGGTRVGTDVSDHWVQTFDPSPRLPHHAK